MVFSNFEQKILDKLKGKNLEIALPEIEDQRVQLACSYMLEQNIVRRVWVPHGTRKLSEFVTKDTLDLSIYSQKISYFREAQDDLPAQMFDFLESSYSNRKKFISRDQIESNANSALFQSGYLLSKGVFAASVAGSLATTAEVISAGLKTIGLDEYIKTVSGAFIMASNQDDRIYIYSDAGVTIDPKVEQLVEIASSACKLWEKVLAYKEPPKVAFLSFSTKGSAKHPHCQKMNDARIFFKEKHPSIICEGEIQFDAAIDATVCKKKAPGSMLKGDANIFIFPNLDAGNIAYKITQRLGHYEAYGPLLLGFKKPFWDLSRGCSSKDIIMTSAIALSYSES